MTRAYTRRAVGRPRDPAIDARIMDAALVVYAAHGWAGFTVKAVAAEGGFSRDSITRRFATRTDLLIEALAASGLPVVEYIPEQSLYEWLLEIAQRMFDIFVRGHRGRAHLRLHLDASIVPDLFQTYRQRVMAPALIVMQNRVLEVAESDGCYDVDPMVVLEDVIGSSLIHAMLNQDADGTAKDLENPVRAHLEAIVSRALHADCPSPVRGGVKKKSMLSRRR